MQKPSAGPKIRNVDKNNDDPSGPKMNLPPNKNLWNIKQNKETIGIEVNAYCFITIEIMEL